ncbi:tRNA (adenosine(37)-N6)-threonylcarbamoyltransferase complex ATPase subunit type 1 TsaE [Martelella soudanensis]|uniref:tRNA (adenosine(37)-N6)-threonylcarbamoyltransferase complex ATPase subunit type 1 TsaE n=1 Tax=unclassified Martelella TaxID=2629616 RepID=UPI0015DDB46F|nr:MULTISPECIES: tRNA (adenosine(37)-N6)-threonylcarbamoyltransferase complex ATPase subunit type 1 TsaE [unclassified Martelella]
MSSVFLPDEAATIAFAGRLAPLLIAGDCLLLDGDLGMGKSTFARALIRARLGDPALEVPSPTFTLVQIYDGAPPLWHFDLYRLSDPDELIELGIDEALAEAISLIEWPDRGEGVLPRDALRLTFAEEGAGRRVRLSGRRVGELAAAL